MNEVNQEMKTRKAAAFDTLVEAVRFCAAKRGYLTIRYDDDENFTVYVAGQKSSPKKHLADALACAKQEHNINPVSEIVIKVEYAKSLPRAASSTAQGIGRKAKRAAAAVQEAWKRAKSSKEGGK